MSTIAMQAEIERLRKILLDLRENAEAEYDLEWDGEQLRREIIRVTEDMYNEERNSYG